jgi:hypothetical protein
MPKRTRAQYGQCLMQMKACTRAILKLKVTPCRTLSIAVRATSAGNRVTVVGLPVVAITLQLTGKDGMRFATTFLPVGEQAVGARLHRDERD